MTPQRTPQRRSVGALIGSVLGLVYVVVNAGVLPSPSREVVRALGLVAFLVLLTRVRSSTPANDITPTDRSGFGGRYWLVVTVEVLVGLGGAAVLTGPLEAPNAALPWVTLVVGVHFFALGALWGQPFHHVLGAALTACGVAGLAAAAGGAADAVIATIAGTIPGAILLAAGYWGTRADRPGSTKPDRADVERRADTWTSSASAPQDGRLVGQRRPAT